MIATSGFLAALECTKFVFGRGSALHPAEGANSAPQTPRWFKGDPATKGKGRTAPHPAGGAYMQRSPTPLAGLRVTLLLRERGGLLRIPLGELTTLPQTT